MKKKYAFHPSDYAIGETEKFYSDMAAKGWQLEDRGVLLSRFKQSESKKLKYRVEIAPKKTSEENPFSEEQIFIFEECGWKYITSCNFIHIFSAPENSDVPEFYLEPEQHAETLKYLRRSYIKDILYFFFLFAFNFKIYELFLNNSRTSWNAKYFYEFVENPIMLSSIFILLLFIFVGNFIGIWHLSHLYRKMKKGIPLDHSPKIKRLNARPVFCSVFCLILIIVLISTAIGCLPNKTYALPTETNEPFILLADIGVDGVRRSQGDPLFGNNIENEVEYSRSVLTEHWSCGECKINGSDKNWIKQDVFRLRYEAMSKDLADALFVYLVIPGFQDEYYEIKIDGFDYVLANEDLDCYFIVNGNYVYVIELSLDSEDYANKIFETIIDKELA